MSIKHPNNKQASNPDDEHAQMLLADAQLVQNRARLAQTAIPGNAAGNLVQRLVVMHHQYSEGPPKKVQRRQRFCESAMEILRISQQYSGGASGNVDSIPTEEEE